MGEPDVKRGGFLDIPYDWRKPTRARLKVGVWDPQDRWLLVPKVFRWGYGVNVREVLRRLRLPRR